MKQKIELNVPYSEYKPIYERSQKIENRVDEITSVKEWYKNEEMHAEWRSLIHERSKLSKKLEEMRPHLIPEVGMPCTVIFYSDRSSGYICEVLSPKKIVVQMDGVYHGKDVFTFRSNGHWVLEGTTSRDWGSLCALGFKENYYDMSF